MNAPKAAQMSKTNLRDENLKTKNKQEKPTRKKENGRGLNTRALKIIFMTSRRRNNVSAEKNNLRRRI